jgi:iron complex transport system substrate-binding protein
MNRRALLAMLALAACRTRPPSRDAGARASRIVSLSPSTTETVFALGAGALLVGRSRYCDHPPEVQALPEVGGYVDPSFEAILALTPDLVTGARGPAGDVVAKRLEARGIATYFPEAESFAAIEEMIAGLGARTGRTADADRLVRDLRSRAEDVRSRWPDSAPKPRVLLVFGLEPLSVAGPGSFADEMIRRAGGINVIEHGGAYPTIGVEQVLVLDPDVVVNAAIAETHGSQRIGRDSPGWSKVRAVARGDVRAVEDETVLRPGPRVGEGLAVLAQAIHAGSSSPGLPGPGRAGGPPR